MSYTDRGWAWVVLIGGILATLQWTFMIRCFGVLYLEFIDYFNSSSTIISWLGSLNMVVAGLTGPFSAALIKRFSHRSVSIVGGLLGFVAFLSSALARRQVTLFISFGFFGGLTASFSYISAMSMVGVYFKKRRALAFALLMLGSCLTAFAGPPLIRVLLDRYGYRGAMCLFAALNLHVCVGGALFRPLKATVPSGSTNQKMEDSPDGGNERLTVVRTLRATERTNSIPFIDGVDEPIDTEEIITEFDDIRSSPNEPEENPNDTKETPAKPKRSFLSDAWHVIRDYFDVTLLSDSRLVSMFFLLYGVFTYLSLTSGLIPAVAVDLGFTKLEGAFLLSVAGLTGFAHMPAAALFDIKRLKPYIVYMYACVGLVNNLSAYLVPVTTNYVGQIFLAIVRGLFMTTTLSQRSTIAVELVGSERLAHALGYILVIQALGSLTGRGLAGIIRDRLGSFAPAFYFSGVVMTTSIVIFVIVNLCHRRRTKKALPGEDGVPSKA